MRSLENLRIGSTAEIITLDTFFGCLQQNSMTVSFFSRSVLPTGGPRVIPFAMGLFLVSAVCIALTTKFKPGKHRSYLLFSNNSPTSYEVPQEEDKKLQVTAQRMKELESQITRLEKGLQEARAAETQMRDVHVYKYWKRIVETGAQDIPTQIAMVRHGLGNLAAHVHAVNPDSSLVAPYMKNLLNQKVVDLLDRLGSLVQVMESAKTKN